jgi:hypothetical protein
MSVYSIAAVGFTLRECGVFNTTATGVQVKLARLSTAGTPGSAITPGKYNPDAVAASATPFQTHTVAPTATDLGYRAQLGAAVGSGVIWTFGDLGIRSSVGTANGIGVIIDAGTGQVCEIYFVWDE